MIKNKMFTYRYTLYYILMCFYTINFIVFNFLVNRSHVYIGFAGLFLGSGVGFLIGISIKPSAISVTHMKAASAINYNGTEVIFFTNYCLHVHIILHICITFLEYNIIRRCCDSKN